MNEKPIAFTLIHAAHMIEEHLEEVLSEVGLSGAKFAALSTLADTVEPLSLCDLAAKLSCVRSNVTQLVDRLEAEGLVRRVDDPKDRRGVRAEITALGQERQAAGAERVSKVHQELERQLGAIDAEKLERALSAIT